MQILALSTGEVLSVGRGLRFDEEGLVIVGRKVPLAGQSFAIGQEKFEASSDFWAMLDRNRREADAKKHIRIKDGVLYHDDQQISLDILKVKGIHEAIYWQDWVVCIGIT